MRYKVYFGLALLFTILMIVTGLTFEYYINVGSFSWRVEVIFLLLFIITFIPGILQFDLKIIELGNKHHHKWILAIFPIAMVSYVLSNVLTREYDLPVLIGLVVVTVVSIFGVIYMFAVSYVIIKEDGLVVSHMFKPKRIEIKYEDIISIDRNNLF